MRNYGHRLGRIEERIRTDGCRTCREWSEPSKLEILTEEEDAANPLPEVPDTCPDCSRAIERQIQRIVITRRPDGPA